MPESNLLWKAAPVVFGVTCTVSRLSRDKISLTLEFHAPKREPLTRIYKISELFSELSNEELKNPSSGYQHHVLEAVRTAFAKTFRGFAKTFRRF
jgi:hypothetical protein